MGFARTRGCLVVGGFESLLLRLVAALFAFVGSGWFKRSRSLSGELMMAKRWRLSAKFGERGMVQVRSDILAPPECSFC